MWKDPHVQRLRLGSADAWARPSLWGRPGFCGCSAASLPQPAVTTNMSRGLRPQFSGGPDAQPRCSPGAPPRSPVHTFTCTQCVCLCKTRSRLLQWLSDSPSSSLITVYFIILTLQIIQ